jgi:hypothetical protein
MSLSLVYIDSDSGELVDNYSDLGNRFPVDVASQQWPIVRAAAGRLPCFVLDDFEEVSVRIERESVLAIRENSARRRNAEAGAAICGT